MHSLNNIDDRKRLRQAAVLCGAVVACAAMPAFAAAPAQPAKPAKAAPATATETAPGLVVVRDAATGRLRAPTRDEANEIGRKSAADAKSRAAAAHNLRKAGASATQALSSDADGATFVTAAGFAGAKLDESSYAYAVVTRKPDGSLVMGCVDGLDKAKQAVREGVVAEHAKESSDETK